jgi:hypothetical protein
MDRFNELKPLTNILESSKDELIDSWLASHNASSVFARYDIGTEYFRKSFADGLFESIIGLIKWGSSVTSSEGFERFLLFANQKMVRYHELVLLQDSIRASFISILYKEGVLSKKILDFLMNIKKR